MRLGRGGWLDIRPTARGWQALVVGVLVLAVARLIGTTQFHQLAYALLILPVAALVLGFANSRGLGFARRVPHGSRVTAGKPAGVDLLLSNGSRFGTSGVCVTDHLPGPKSLELPPLEAYGDKRVSIPLSFARRGIYELGPAEVGVVDPFSLLRFARKFDERTEVVVHPEVHDLPGFPIRGGDADAGGRGSVGQRGGEFASLREYRHGDDRRHIHWKSVARTGDLFVKEFSLHAPRRYTVALDLRRGGLRAVEGAVEDAVSTAASVLTHLRRESLPFRLMCTDGKESFTEFGFDDTAYWRSMRILAAVGADGDEELGEAVLRKKGALGEGIVLISRNADERLADCVRKLRGAGLSVVVVALATHTYRASVAPAEREASYLRYAASLEAAGATVRAVRHPEGVAGLAANGLGARGIG